MVQIGCGVLVLGKLLNCEATFDAPILPWGDLLYSHIPQ